MNFLTLFLIREGSNPEKFIYSSDLLTKYQHNIHIVTEWITNEGLDSIDEIKNLIIDIYSELHKNQNSNEEGGQCQVLGSCLCY